MNHITPPLSHDQVLILVVQLALLLFAARGLGELMRRLGQPTVIGELLAGIILGPSVLGTLLPAVRVEIFPPDAQQAHLLQVVSWLGVMLLLAVTGLETDLELIRRQGRLAMLTALMGIAVPFISGLALGWLIPKELLVHPDQRSIFSLFLATAMSISAIPVIAKILIDLNLIRRDIGQVTLAAGMANDALGWILLSVVAGLASSGSLDWGALVRSVVGVVVFIGAGLTIGQKLVNGLLSWMRSQDLNDDATLSAALVLIFTAGAITESLGLEAVLGAFITGILLNRSPRFWITPRRTLEKVTLAIFAPIFFASAGLQINLAQLANLKLILVAAAVLAVACLGKFLGAYLGARWGGMSRWEALSLGAGMNARGAMEIIIAIIGVSLGILSQEMYTIIVLMAVATSLMAPPLLRWTIRGVPLKPEEEKRLQREAARSQSFIENICRVLLPTRGGANSQLASQLIGHLSQRQFLQLTALSASGPERSGWRPRLRSPGIAPTSREEAQQALEAIRNEIKFHPDGDFVARVAGGHSVPEVILEEARKGYDLLVMGASEVGGPVGVLFNNVVDRVIQQSPCPTLVVKSRLPVEESSPIQEQSIRQILVPTAGSDYSRQAAELAFALASMMKATVTLLHVVNRSQLNGMLGTSLNELDAAVEIAQQILEHQAEVGRQMGAEVHTQLEIKDYPEIEIVRIAEEGAYDLLILGTRRRVLTGRAFFGHRVDHILRYTHCPVAILSTS